MKQQFYFHYKQFLILYFLCNLLFGVCLLASEKLNNAIEKLKLNVENYPDSPNTYDRLGEAYMQNGQTDLAIMNYNKSLELNPNNENATKMIDLLNVQLEKNNKDGDFRDILILSAVLFCVV